MRYIAATRQVELDNSSPENLVQGSVGTYFYRDGNEKFYLVNNNEYKRVDIYKKAMALQYSHRPWYNTIDDREIIFSEPYEIWIKKRDTGKTSGWQFLSYSKMTFDEFSS